MVGACQQQINGILRAPDSEMGKKLLHRETTTTRDSMISHNKTSFQGGKAVLRSRPAFWGLLERAH